MNNEEMEERFSEILSLMRDKDNDAWRAVAANRDFLKVTMWDSVRSVPVMGLPTTMFTLANLCFMAGYIFANDEGLELEEFDESIFDDVEAFLGIGEGAGEDEEE